MKDELHIINNSDLAPYSKPYFNVNEQLVEELFKKLEHDYCKIVKPHETYENIQLSQAMKTADFKSGNTIYHEIEKNKHGKNRTVQYVVRPNNYKSSYSTSLHGILNNEERNIEIMNSCYSFLFYSETDFGKLFNLILQRESSDLSISVNNFINTIQKLQELVSYQEEVAIAGGDGYSKMYENEIYQLKNLSIKLFNDIGTYFKAEIDKCFFSYEQSVIEDLSIVNGVNCYIWKTSFNYKSLVYLRVLFFDSLISCSGLDKDFCLNNIEDLKYVVEYC